MSEFLDQFIAELKEHKDAQGFIRDLMPNQKPPYDLKDWLIDRFKGDAPKMQWLVKDLIPLGTAGALYSVGGVGKSSLALDLAIRVAIALAFPNKWLEAYPIDQGGAVVYLSGEEPDPVLHTRMVGLCRALAELTSTSFDQVFNEASKNLYLANLWGMTEPLFTVKSTTLEPSDEYERIKKVLGEAAQRADQDGKSLRLVVIDTRSRFSGAEGAGNALVAREVNLFERLACDFGATILILHHVTKASLNGGNPMAASRGESSFLDSLRFSIHLEPLPVTTALKNSISDEERSDYMVLSNTKQNYGRLQGPIVVRRKEFKFVKTEINTKELKVDKKQRQMADARDKVVAYVVSNPGCLQKDVIAALRETISQSRCRGTLDDLEQEGLLSCKVGDRGARQYFLTESEPTDENM